VKVKLDENLGAMGAVFLKAAGVDVATVADQNLLSTPDADLVRTCATEGRCLVTLDRDFSDPLRYPPSRYAGPLVSESTVRRERGLLQSIFERAIDEGYDIRNRSVASSGGRTSHGRGS